jgi:two-component sensor histidine kinase
MAFKGAWGAPASIRVRLGAALAIALLPVLVLGVIQSVLAYQKDADIRRDTLVRAAQLSAATARARIESGVVVLETITPRAVGLQCAQRLSQATSRLSGYANLIRFDATGRVVCSANGALPDPNRRDSDWFSRVSHGEPLVVTRASPAQFGADPAVLAAVPAHDENGAFDGAMTAVIRLTSLRPEIAGGALPRDTEVAIADEAGRIVNQTDPLAFSSLAHDWRAQAKAKGAVMFTADDTRGVSRVYAVAPLVGDDLYVILSSPAQGLASWTEVNLLSSVVPPLLAFLLALGAVWIVTEQVVVRWLHYLQRVAAIYARGRFSVRAVHAHQAPPEIRELGETLDLMADTIVERDQALHDHQAQKDDLMREIHHRVKNNLQIISSLVSMQQRALTDASAKSAMLDTRQRISALALVYRALYQGPDLRHVDLKTFLEDLTAQLVVPESAYGHVVKTQQTPDQLIIDPDKLAPLALFSVEAITNAQKHAFAGRGGELSVHFRVRDHVATLEISDAGGSDPDANPSLGEGVGRTLMTAFARQLGGRAEFEANERRGLTARLIFPAPPQDAAPFPAPPGKLKRNQRRD